MRQFALLSCFFLLSAGTMAQEEMDEGCGCGCACGPAEEQEHDISPPDNLPGQEVVDKAGNFKLKLPKGWELAQPPPEERDTFRRIVAQRMDAYGNILITLVVLREEETRAETFTLDSPGDVLNRKTKNGMFDGFYGQGAGAGMRPPEINEGILLGGAEKSGEYEISAITTDEEEQIRKAEDLKRRDPKTVVPEFKPIIIRGRISLVSPFVYMANASLNRDVGDRPELMAEIKQVLDSFEYLEAGEMPPPLVVYRQRVGDTKSDPANTEAKKLKTVYAERGKKTYKVELTYNRPAGFVAKENAGGNESLRLWAQDSKNNWVEILVLNASWKRAGEQNADLQDKPKVFETWASNWESKARGVKVPRKPQKFGLGKVRGTGYKKLEGTVEKFRGTWEGVLMDKSGWRTMLTIETRGEGDSVFAKEIKYFLKGLKFNFKAK